MRDNKSLYELIKNQLEKEQAESDVAEEITRIVFPVLDALTRGQIINPVTLKVMLAKLDPKYRDEVFGLLRLAIEGGPEGSFIILDAAKVLALLDMIEEMFEMQDDENEKNEKKEKKKKEEQETLEEEFSIEDYEDEIKQDAKIIIGVTKKIVVAIRSLALAKLSAMCHLVNDVVLRKVINTPSPQGVKSSVVEAIPLDKEVKKKRSR